jgi:hypothetical protein
MTRLYARGYLERAIGRGLPLHYAFRLTDAGLDAAIAAGVIK